MYKPFDTFIFRTPFFPLTAIDDFESNQYDNVFKEMLQVATPDLAENISNISNKTQYPSYRYYQRACTRPTPFGLFAGCSVGVVGEHTDIILFNQYKYKRKTRLDMDYICALTQQIEKDRNIREKLCFFSNNSIYPVGNNFRYVEYFYQNKRLMHRIAQIENSEYVLKILNLARGGAWFYDIVESLVNDEITSEEATEFIHELIDSQVLLSELNLSVTDVEPLYTLISKLNFFPNLNKNILYILSEIKTQLADIDRQPIGTTTNLYTKIIKNIEKTKIESEIKYLFQTDMFKMVQQATISRNMLRDIQQSLTFLNKINLPVTQTNISKFKENFTKRYEEREMPLLFVLDNELGIGYADNISGDICPLIDDLVIPRISSPISPPYIPIQSILLQKIQQSTLDTIEITDEDVKGIEALWDDLPPTFSVMCQILQDNEQGRSVYIRSIGGTSAANLLGRFCHLDEQILNYTLAITENEKKNNTDVIYAEIVHLPESRLGNILLRPVLRQYEIPYLSKSSVSGEFELRLDDMYVSVKNNRIILRSKRLNKEIIPRLSTAHNYGVQNSMPVYHFLCDLQHQYGRIGLGFHWNETAQQLNYLPRVIYKNCILSKARWIVFEKEIKHFAGIKSDFELLEKLKKWQNSRNIPNIVLFVDGDNELFIDLNNPLSIRAWLSVVKKRQSFKIEEFLFKSETAVVRGPEGAFTNEFIFAFYRDTNIKKK